MSGRAFLSFLSAWMFLSLAVAVGSNLVESWKRADWVDLVVWSCPMTILSMGGLAFLAFGISDLLP